MSERVAAMFNIDSSALAEVAGNTESSFDLERVGFVQHTLSRYIEEVLEREVERREGKA